MPNESSLLHAYLLDAKGGGKKLNWDEVAKWRPKDGILWVHLQFTAKTSELWLTKESGLDSYAIQGLTAEETRPRSITTHDGILLYLRGVNQNPGQDPEDMVSVRVWIDEHRIISTQRRNLFSVSDIAQAIENNIGPKTPTEFLTLLNFRLIDRMANVIDKIEEEVDTLDEQVVDVQSRLLRPKLADIRREAIMIRRYLAPQREALHHLQFEPSKLLTEIDKLHIREASDRLTRYIEDLDSARDRAAISQEELSSRLSEQLNQRMYFLSIAALIFLPLTFITGMLGVNLGGIPGSHSKWGFSILAIILLAIFSGTILWLRRQKWM